LTIDKTELRKTICLLWLHKSILADEIGITGTDEKHGSFVVVTARAHPVRPLIHGILDFPPNQLAEYDAN